MHRKVGFPSPMGRGWPATALSPAVAGRVRGQLHGEDTLQGCFAALSITASTYSDRNVFQELDSHALVVSSRRARSSRSGGTGGIGCSRTPVISVAEPVSKYGVAKIHVDNIAILR